MHIPKCTISVCITNGTHGLVTKDNRTIGLQQYFHMDTFNQSQPPSDLADNIGIWCKFNNWYKCAVWFYRLISGRITKAAPIPLSLFLHCSFTDWKIVLHLQLIGEIINKIVSINIWLLSFFAILRFLLDAVCWYIYKCKWYPHTEPNEIRWSCCCHIAAPIGT